MHKGIALMGLALAPLFASENADWGWGPQPIVGYDEEEGWTLGASNVFYWDPDTTNKNHEVDELDLTTTVTTEKSFNVHTEITKYFAEDTYNLGVELGCEKASSRYYGVKGHEDSVLAKYYTINVPFGVSYSLTPFRDLHIIPQYEMHYLYNGGLKSMTDSAVDVPEFKDHDFTSGIGLSMEYGRTNPGIYKRNGYKLSFSSMHFADWLGSRHNFELISTNYRHYVPLGKESVFAWQIKYERGTGDVPHFHMPALGGNKILRGFDKEKYKAKNVAAAQIELRIPLFWRLGATTFLGLGNAAEHFHDLKDEIHTAGGIGFRFQVQKKQKINIRFDFTYNDEHEIQKCIKIKEAF